MKQTFKLYRKWIITAIVLIPLSILFFFLGFFFSKDPLKNPDLPLSIYTKDPTATYIAFNTNYAIPDTTLTATVINPGDAGEYEFTWYRNNERIEGASDASYTPTEQDLESFLSVIAKGSSETLSASLYCSKLPVVYIETEDEIGDGYVAAKMATSGNKDYNILNSEFYYGEIQIKLRGNSTKYRDKHPYKIALDQKADLYQMGANKHWVLLANDIDHTLIRNKLVYDFSGALGMNYMESVNVAVILNNSYEGVYQLCEQVRIDETRVDIFSWKALAKEAAKRIADVRKETEGLSADSAKQFQSEIQGAMERNLYWISEPHIFSFSGTEYDISKYVDIPSVTGGFLVEMDFYSVNDPSSIKTAFQQPFYFNTPDPDIAAGNRELMDYARKYLQAFEYAIHSSDFCYHEDASHDKGVGYYYNWDEETWIGGTEPFGFSAPEYDKLHYTELFDFDSLVQNFLVCEFSMNWDSMKNSVFVSKDIDSLAKISPVWDFDWAFGNDNMYSIYTDVREGWHTKNNYFTNEQYYQSVQWNRYLIKDPYFLLAVYNKYQEIRPTLIEDMIKEGGLLDQYREELKEAGAANDARWDYSYGAYQGKSFEASMDHLEAFITTRIHWMDEQMTSFETFVASLDSYKTNNMIKITQEDSDTFTITSSGTLAKKFTVMVNGNAYTEELKLEGNSASITIPSSALKEEGTNLIYVVAPNGASNYLVF